MDEECDLWARLRSDCLFLPFKDFLSVNCTVKIGNALLIRSLYAVTDVVKWLGNYLYVELSRLRRENPFESKKNSIAGDFLAWRIILFVFDTDVADDQSMINFGLSPHDLDQMIDACTLIADEQANLRW